MTPELLGFLIGGTASASVSGSGDAYTHTIKYPAFDVAGWLRAQGVTVFETEEQLARFLIVQHLRLAFLALGYGLVDDTRPR